MACEPTKVRLTLEDIEEALNNIEIRLLGARVMFYVEFRAYDQSAAAYELRCRFKRFEVGTAEAAGREFKKITGDLGNFIGYTSWSVEGGKIQLALIDGVTDIELRDKLRNTDYYAQPPTSNRNALLLAVVCVHKFFKTLEDNLNGD